MSDDGKDDISNTILISTVAGSCFSFLNESLPVLSAKLQEWRCSFTSLDLQMVREQYEIWTKNFGVFALNEASLDYRLRDASSVKLTIISHLKRIEAGLRACTYAMVSE